MRNTYWFPRFLLLSAACFLLLCCGSGNGDPIEPTPTDSTLAWVQIEKHNLNVTEPSGLVYDEAHDRFLTVSDRTGRIYAISRTGEILHAIQWVGEDLEAITIDPVDGSIYVAEERVAVIHHLDSEGALLDTIQLDRLVYGGNHGIEGLSVAPGGERLFVLIESGPGMLLELDESGIMLDSVELTFAEDYSGLHYLGDDSLLVVSDRDKNVTKILTDGTVIESLDLLDIVNPEGIALVKDTLYVVSDEGEYMALFVKGNIPVE